MLSGIILLVDMLIVLMLFIVARVMLHNTGCHYAERRCAKYRYAEQLHAECRGTI
jgi:hypothetical protein